MKALCLVLLGTMALSCIPLSPRAETQLTVYNGGFAVVKEARQLDLKQGENEVRVSDITAHVEPDSVILRGTGKGDPVKILEQNYESDPLSEDLLLRKMEGKEITFEVDNPAGAKSYVKGKVLRSGYVPHYEAFQTFGRQYQYQQQVVAQATQPIIEIDGKINFGLPGKPIFDALDPKEFLKPTLLWKLSSGAAGQVPVELSYITGGMVWEASYNLVAPEKGDVFDMTGWVTLQNMSGKDFEDTSVKLMAGDVARAQDESAMAADAVNSFKQLDKKDIGGVSEKSFDEFHLYTLPRPLELLDREVKQVELICASAIHGKRTYVYDGAADQQQYRGWNLQSLRVEPNYGVTSQTKVWSMMEFKNSADDGLGMPLPAGKIKLYRTDSDGRPEFIGEDRIDHTPKDETVRLYTGNSFDLVGQRKRSSFAVDQANHWTDEAYEITVSNHKKEAAQIRVVEHLNRSENWSILQKTVDYVAKDSNTIEFPVDLAPDESKTITYKVHYTW